MSTVLVSNFKRVVKLGMWPSKQSYMCSPAENKSCQRLRTCAAPNTITVIIYLVEWGNMIGTQMEWKELFVAKTQRGSHEQDKLVSEHQYRRNTELWKYNVEVEESVRYWNRIHSDMRTLWHTDTGEPTCRALQRWEGRPAVRVDAISCCLAGKVRVFLPGRHFKSALS